MTAKNTYFQKDPVLSIDGDKCIYKAITTSNEIIMWQVGDTYEMICKNEILDHPHEKVDWSLPVYVGPAGT